jgi:hypothetical protein
VTRPAAAEWIRFLEAAGSEEACEVLRRRIGQLESTADDISEVIREFPGSPSDELEECLRIARSAAHEAIEFLRVVISVIRKSEPDVA